MEIQQAIKHVTERRDLSKEDMRTVMTAIMSGEVTPAQIGGFLVGLRMKGETVDEVAAAADVMREMATPVVTGDLSVVDIVGTGGDGLRTFNISTACCFVVAAAGGYVAKHGNRSVSSSSGAADVLEKAGLRLDLSPAQISRCIEETGVGFMFAPAHHAAMKYAIGPRRELAIRTLFNVLGPLTNPAKVKRQLLGVYDQRWVEPLAAALIQLGSEHAMVVHARDGMDEISIGSRTDVAELREGGISVYTISPEDFGLARADCAELVVENAEQSLHLLQAVLGGKKGPASDIVALNAGAALYVSGLAESLSMAVNKAQVILSSGAALQRLQQLTAFSQTV
ncbi:MAG TPA: anthranilate phosphoribosyltransferase [Gammaproteobacteria bacterium]|nr:anthranilate phosphoribosyltransferase [Gammaproteobacteria bacterium]